MEPTLVIKCFAIKNLRKRGSFFVLISLLCSSLESNELLLFDINNILLTKDIDILIEDVRFQNKRSVNFHILSLFIPCGKSRQVYFFKLHICLQNTIIRTDFRLFSWLNIKSKIIGFTYVCNEICLKTVNTYFTNIY